ncbi:MAG: hypothetical protein IKG27_06200 [Bacilli bacterium]|nr:hypothetical protein [Bacilli bacterium]
MNRKPLDLTSLPNIIKEMIEGNANAACIIDELIKTKGENNTLAILIILDDMNIRGSQLYNLYKMCEQDINNFYEKVINMSEKDTEELNSNSFAITKYKAIFEGTSKDRENNPDKYIFSDEERNNIRNKKSKDMARDILEEKQTDLYPSITSKEALQIINKKGFTLGYQKTYETNNKKIIYRVFYNEYGDILYTHSLEKPDIFLWGESKLHMLRHYNHQKYDNIKCNIYKNIRGIISYVIELKEKPFKTYEEILERKEEKIKEYKPEYYDSNMLPIIKSLDSLKYKEKNKDYNSIVIASIYNLMVFPETYYDLDKNLKQIYKKLLENSEVKAYDEIIYQLNANDSIEIAKKIQDVLRINLDKEKLLKAKARYQEKIYQNTNAKNKILSHFIENPEDINLKTKIDKISKIKVEIN